MHEDAATKTANKVEFIMRKTKQNSRIHSLAMSYVWEVVRSPAVFAEPRAPGAPHFNYR